MRFVTWNVNSIKARLPRLIAFLKRHDPDVVCLQELKCVEENFPYEDLFELGYHPVVVGQKTYNGVAILAKSKPVKIKKGFQEGSGEQARFVACNIVGKARIVGVYVPNGQSLDSDKFMYKLEWMEQLRKYFDDHHAETEPIILAGDFNVAPEDRDIHDPAKWEGAIHASPKERKALAAIQDFGFDDAFRIKEKGAGHYSWWDYRGMGFQRGEGLRIDFVFTTPPVTRKIKKIWIDTEERGMERPSDHAPIICDIDI